MMDDSANLRSLTMSICSLPRMVQDLDMACFTYSGYGKKFIKSQRMSPDSYIQMAIQLAFYRYCPALKFCTPNSWVLCAKNILYSDNYLPRLFASM